MHFVHLTRGYCGDEADFFESKMLGGMASSTGQSTGRVFIMTLRNRRTAVQMRSSRRLLLVCAWKLTEPDEVSDSGQVLHASDSRGKKRRVSISLPETSTRGSSSMKLSKDRDRLEVAAEPDRPRMYDIESRAAGVDAALDSGCSVRSANSRKEL